MGSFLRQHSGAVLLSLGLHGVLAVALTVTAQFSGRSRAALPVEQVAIQATVVDEALIQREMERLEQQEQQEIQRRQQEERQAREQAQAARRELEEEQRRLEAVRQEQEEAARVEQIRLTELQRQRDEEQVRLARVREEEQRRQREEEERRAREAVAARQRAEMEAELQRELAFEEDRRRAEQAGLLDEYIRLIENRIQQNWIPPVSARPGLECVVNVTQIPSGEVVDVRVGRCNGDEAVVRSIEAAVLNASPLPRPPTPSLFERNLEVVFNPEV